MRIVQGTDIPFAEPGGRLRGGKFLQQKLLEGEPGSKTNYLLQKAHTTGDFVSPRHKHNFDQFRFQLQGTFQFGRDGTMAPGVVGYFPEGTHYGPQTSSDDSLTLVLQFGGASGNGYMSVQEVAASAAELRKHGVFKDGVYVRENPDGGRKNQDAYEATWENYNKRPLKYPSERFQTPVFMNPENFAWVDQPGEPGVAIKLLGCFGERRTEVGFLRLDEGATHASRGPRLFAVMSGAGTLEDQPWKSESAIELKHDERGVFSANTAAELFFIGLPLLQ